MKIRFCSFLTIALFLLPALQGTERDSLSLLRTIAEYEALPAKWIETVIPTRPPGITSIVLL